MTLIQAIVLGLIQGIAGFLPGSGSALVFMAGHLMETDAVCGLPYLTVLQLGSALAVISVFRKDLLRIAAAAAAMCADIAGNLRIWLGDRIRGRDTAYHTVIRGPWRRLTTMMLVSFCVTCVIGRIFYGTVLKVSGSLVAISMGCFVTALVLMIAAYLARGAGAGDRERVPLSEALIAGGFQGAAVFPGVSRIGMLTACGSMFGFSRKLLARYVYLLCVPTAAAALVLQVLRGDAAALADAGFLPCAAGALAAFLTGRQTLRVLRNSLNAKRSFLYAGYNLLLGIAAIVLHVVR